jgi:predicted MFS family arabinose efflux permease
VNERAALWALLLGNFVVGTGVMLVPAQIDLLAADFGATIPQIGWIVSATAAAMCVAAPTVATFTSRLDRRVLLAGGLLLFGASLFVNATQSGYWPFLLVRVLGVIGAAVLVPQAAATASLMLPPARRASGITFVYLGWSLALVAGMPASTWLGAKLGWQATFIGVGVAHVLIALAVLRLVPAKLQATPMSLAVWKRVAADSMLVLILLVTLVSAAGQYSVRSYFVPLIQSLLIDDPAVVSILLSWIGVFGLIGNLVATRTISRVGPSTNVNTANLSMAVGAAFIGLFGGSIFGFLLCGVFLGVGMFTSNSSQQARLAATAPELASASVAMNTSMFYLGQALGTAIGGFVIQTVGYDDLPLVAAVVLCGAVFLSSWILRRQLEIDPKAVVAR